PGGQAPVHVTHTMGCVRVKRGDRHVERVDERAMLARELLQRIAVGDDQLKARTDDIVEAPLAAGTGDRALDAERAGERIRLVAEGAMDNAAGEGRELGGRWWLGLA